MSERPTWRERHDTLLRDYNNLYREQAEAEARHRRTLALVDALEYALVLARLNTEALRRAS